jgi:hypothetical protein
VLEPNLFYIPQINRTHPICGEQCLVGTSFPDGPSPEEALIARSYFDAPLPEINHARGGHFSSKFYGEGYPGLELQKKSSCSSCVMGKSHHHSVAKAKTVGRVTRPGQRILFDMSGKYPITSWGGFWYWLGAMDEYSEVCDIYLVTKKSEIFQKMDFHAKHVRNTFGVGAEEWVLDAAPKSICRKQ